MKGNKVLLILAALAVIGAFLMIANGNLTGVLVFLIAACLGMVAMMRTRNAAGYGNDDAGFNGIAGTGRQQSEVEKLPQNVPEGSGNIWDRVEKK